MQRYEEKFNLPHLLCIFNLTLTQFVLRVLLVDDKQTTLATHDLAVGCTLFQ